MPTVSNSQQLAAARSKRATKTLAPSRSPGRHHVANWARAAHAARGAESRCVRATEQVARERAMP
jgi:hypothetical protein